MANATDRLNQLQQYMNFYRANMQPMGAQTGAQGSMGGQGGGFGNGVGNFSYSGAGGGPATMADWANAQIDSQNKQQNMEDENAAFKGMYGGNAQSQFGAPPAYVQPQNQQQQPNPYSARAMQLNGGGQNGGQNGGNTLADMFRNYNKGG